MVCSKPVSLRHSSRDEPGYGGPCSNMANQWLCLCKIRALSYDISQSLPFKKIHAYLQLLLGHGSTTRGRRLKPQVPLHRLPCLGKVPHICTVETGYSHRNSRKSHRDLGTKGLSKQTNTVLTTTVVTTRTILPAIAVTKTLILVLQLCLPTVASIGLSDKQTPLRQLSLSLRRDLASILVRRGTLYELPYENTLFLHGGTDSLH
jgi:hypothetical protein